jgi:hypothetical protein
LIELPATAAPLLPPSPLRAGRSHMAAAFTSPRMRGEVERAERARVRGRFRESEPVETPPHPDPLHSPSKTGVNALKACGEREQKRRDTCDHPAHKGEGEEAPNKEARSWRNKATASGAPASSILRAAQRIPSPSRNRVYAGFGHSTETSKSATADFECGGGLGRGPFHGSEPRKEPPPRPSPASAGLAHMARRFCSLSPRAGRGSG